MSTLKQTFSSSNCTGVVLFMLSTEYSSIQCCTRQIFRLLTLFQRNIVERLQPQRVNFDARMFLHINLLQKCFFFHPVFSIVTFAALLKSIPGTLQLSPVKFLNFHDLFGCRDNKKKNISFKTDFNRNLNNRYEWHLTSGYQKKPPGQTLKSSQIVLLFNVSHYRCDNSHYLEPIYSNIQFWSPLIDASTGLTVDV